MSQRHVEGYLVMPRVQLFEGSRRPVPDLAYQLSVARLALAEGRTFAVLTFSTPHSRPAPKISFNDPTKGGADFLIVTRFCKRF